MADAVTQVGMTQKLVRCFSSSCVHPASRVISPGCLALRSTCLQVNMEVQERYP